MKIAFLLYFALLGVGSIAAVRTAVSYWRGTVQNGRKIAMLLMGRTLLDVLAYGIMLWLWLEDIFDGTTVFFAGVAIVATYTVIVRFLEVKLATGKYRFF